MNARNAVMLLSGGLDSATAAAMAVHAGYRLLAMTFSYGQKHDIEIDCAKKVAAFLGVADHVIVDIPSSLFSSALVKGSPLAVPLDRGVSGDGDIGVTYVPARIILFLAYALAYGESRGAGDIFIGANAVDYSGYPDCRPAFFDAFTVMANRGTRSGSQGRPFTIHTPLISMKKHEIIAQGLRLGLDYSMTHSCYEPDERGRACGHCDSCLLRKKGFAEVGVPDPARYRE
jgi:7-cyano-7-deazaguanine synthase